MKKILAMILVLSMALTLVSVAAAEGKSPVDGMTVAFIPKVSGNSFFEAANDGAQKYAAEWGLTVDYIGSPDASVTTQLELIQQAIDKGVDAICISWNRALERLAPEYAGTVTRARLLPCMGMLLPDILHRLVPELDQERMKPILEEVLVEENAYVAAHGGVLYPGVEQTLAVLAARWPLFLVSNCQDGYIEAFFQAHGLGRYFTDYENPGRTGLPKADNIALVAERNGLRRPLYIGDTQGDYDAASKAGVPFLHAAYGFGRIDRPVPSVATFGDLPDAIRRLTPP